MWERRRYKRYNVAIRAEYMKAKGLASLRSITMTKDISLGGISAMMSESVRPGDHIVVRLSLAPEDELTALARVRWASFEIGGLNKCGLEFTWVSSKELLSEYVDLASGMAAA